MSFVCSTEPCPVLLDSACVFYTGGNLLYTGITTNDSLQVALVKIDAKFQNAAIGYVFQNGIVQAIPGGTVKLGGSLIQNTSINSSGYTFTITGDLIAGSHITTGGTSSEFVKGDGSLDSTSYQVAGNYITALTGDGTASGPGSAAFTLSNVNAFPGVYGSTTSVPVITVNSKGLVTSVTNTNINFPAGSLVFTGDVTGIGTTGTNVPLTLATVNSNVYASNTFLKFAVNGKGLVTSAAPITNLDIEGVLGYVPVPNSRTITINGVTQNLSANRTWTIGTIWGSITGLLSAQTDLITYLSSTYTPKSRSLTINGITYDLSADRSWTVSGLPSQTGNNGKWLTTDGSTASWASLPSSGVTSVTATSPLASSGGTTPNITIQQASGSQAGYLSSTDWTTFNNKQNAITLTTTGTSGAATLIGSTLNIPQYSGGGGSGTVTSVQLSAGTGISLSGTNPITTSGTITVTNSAPDQTVTLSAGTGISVSGTYPSFTITNTSPSVGGSVLHGTASGTDTYTATITGPTSYVDGDAYLIRFTNGNTTSATLNINGIGAIPLYRNNDGPLLGGDIENGGEMLCVYNSTLTVFQCIGTSPNTLLAYVTNAESITITKGQAVYAFGGTGDRMTVKLAYNTGDATSAQTVGLVWSTSIGANQKGFIMMQGLLDGLSILPTATYSDGDPVYLGSTAGAITKTKPYAPNHLVYLGVVTTANNGSAGRMYVKVQNGYELDELHNVQAQSPTLKDTLYYDNTVSPAQWKTASISTVLGYTPVGGSGTTNEIAYFTGSTTLGSLTTATYPSLTEISYVKGVTSAIQTQLDSKTSFAQVQRLIAIGI